MQAILLYELADLLDRGIEHLKIPESVWRCSGEPTVYKRIVSNLFSVLCPQVLITDALLGRRLAEEAKFAFACGLWDGMVDVVQSVPQLVKILTCAFHADCLESAASQWTSFKEAVIEDERGNILCHQDEYVCKIRELISAALAELVSDDCQTAHTIGSIVGPIAAMAVGDLAAGEAVLTRLGSVGSGLKYAIKGLQLCDKVTDITRPLAKGLKVTTALVRKAGKLIPEIRIEGRTILHYVEDKLHIRRFDAATSKVVDTYIEENELGQELTSSIKHNRLSKLIFRNVSFEQFKMTFKATQKEYEEAFLLWGNEQWKELNEYFISHNLNEGWPPYNGFIESHKVTLKRGVVLDRYDYNGASLVDGSHRGRFASPKKNGGSMFTFQSRALRGDEADYAEFYDLVVLEDVSVEQGSIIPWFNQPGQGIQIMFSEDIEELIKKGKIAIRNLKKIK